jgi:hypothetical protein
MTNFADRVRETARTKSKTPFKSSAGSITSQIQAQQTGKAAAPTATGQSNIASQTAAASVPSAAPQIQAQAEQMGMQEKQAESQQQMKEQQLAANQYQIDSKINDQVQSLLSNAVASDKKFDLREDNAELEQAGAALRMQDMEYTAKLRRIAKERNLTSDMEFRETMKNEVIGQELSSVLDRISFNETTAHKKRASTLEEALANIQNANAIMDAQMKDQKRGMIIGAVASGVKAGAAYGADNGWFDSAPTGQDPYIGNASPTSTPNFDAAPGFTPTYGPVK